MKSEREVRTLLKTLINSARMMARTRPPDDTTLLIAWAMAGALSWVLEATVEDPNTAELIADCDRIIQNYLKAQQ